VSTILKALRRVEEERGGAPAPRPAVRGDFVAGTPAAAGAPRPSPRRRRGPNLKLWGSLGTALLLGALVWWRLPRPDSAEVVAAVPPPTVREAAPTVREAAPPARAEAPGAQAPAPPAERLARAAPRPAAAPPAAELPDAVAQRLPPLGAPLEEGAAAAPPAPAAAPPAPAPVPAATRPPPPAPRQAAPPPKPTPAAAPAPAATPVARAAPAAKPEPKPAPKAPPAPPQVQIERTSWHPTPERRIAWVRVEGLSGARELREGDAVGALVVKQIRPSSVLFQYGGVEIQRRVGER
jgi:outer membrane biosynthesis protein TonB